MEAPTLFCNDDASEQLRLGYPPNSTKIDVKIHNQQNYVINVTTSKNIRTAATIVPHHATECTSRNANTIITNRQSN